MQHKEFKKFYDFTKFYSFAFENRFRSEFLHNLVEMFPEKLPDKKTQDIDIAKKIFNDIYCVYEEEKENDTDLAEEIFQNTKEVFLANLPNSSDVDSMQKLFKIMVNKDGRKNTPRRTIPIEEKSIAPTQLFEKVLSMLISMVKEDPRFGQIGYGVNIDTHEQDQNQPIVFTTGASSHNAELLSKLFNSIQAQKNRLDTLNVHDAASQLLNELYQAYRVSKGPSPSSKIGVFLRGGESSFKAGVMNIVKTCFADYLSDEEKKLEKMEELKDLLMNKIQAEKSIVKKHSK